VQVVALEDDQVTVTGVLTETFGWEMRTETVGAGVATTGGVGAGVATTGGVGAGPPPHAVKEATITLDNNIRTFIRNSYLI